MPDCSRRNQLLAALRRNRNDPQPYHVYADWLSEVGDPHGALIASQLHQGDTIDGVNLIPADRAWLAHHAPSILGRFGWWLDGQHDRSGRALRWRWGFLASVTISARFQPIDAIVDAALASPAAAVLDTLTIGAQGAASPPILDALCQTPIPLLTMRFGELGDPDDPAWRRFLGRTDWPLHTLSVGGGFTTSPSGARFIERLAESTLLRQLRVVRLPGHFHQATLFSGALETHAEAFAHLDQLQLYCWPGRESVLEDLAARLGNIVWQRDPNVFLPVTVRDHRHFDPPVVCPECTTSLNRASLENERLICTACGRSFLPPVTSGVGHPGPPAALTRP
ncbi:MAG: TIGR02996 domain-containing protein [Myxococcota bacterium]